MAQAKMAMLMIFEQFPHKRLETAITFRASSGSPGPPVGGELLISPAIR